MSNAPISHFTILLIDCCTFIHRRSFCFFLPFVHFNHVKFLSYDFHSIVTVPITSRHRSKGIMSKIFDNRLTFEMTIVQVYRLRRTCKQMNNFITSIQSQCSNYTNSTLCVYLSDFSLTNNVVSYLFENAAFVLSEWFNLYP